MTEVMVIHAKTRGNEFGRSQNVKEDPKFGSGTAQALCDDQVPLLADTTPGPANQI